MSTITLPNIRVGSDLQVRVRLKDGGVAIDWSTLSNIKACIYSDAQRALAGRCAFSIDEEDNTLLVCTYAANKPQYLGVNRIVISAKYMGETKTYDKPAFSFVRWTADQEGEEITIDDPDVDVEIDVEDISSSILQEAVDAAFTAADRANDAAEAAEHMVDIHTGPEGKSAYEVAVDEGFVGTEEEWLASLVGPQGAQGIQGETGEAAGFGSVSAALQEDGGDPSVVVAASGEDTSKNFAFTFKNLKGDKGDKGDQGNTGSSVDYPYELVNNLTTDDATKGLAASQGVALQAEVSQLEAKVIDTNVIETPVELTVYSDGYYAATTGGFVADTTRRRTEKIDVNPGEKYLVTTRIGGSTAIAYLAEWNGETYIGVASGFTGGSGDAVDREYIVPSGVTKIAICSYSTTAPSLKKVTTTEEYKFYTKDEADDEFATKEQMDDANERVSDIEDIVMVDKDVDVPIALTLVTGYYVASDGTFVSESGKKCAEIMVQEGQKYKISSHLRSVVIALIVEWDADNQYIRYVKLGTGNDEDVINYEYTVPSGVAKIGISNANYAYQAVLQATRVDTEKFPNVYTKEEVDNGVGKYGVKWSVSNFNDLGSREFSAFGKTATIGIGNTDGNSDFDNIWPWSGIKRCNIKSNANGASIVTFEGETGFALDGSNGDVFVRIPKFKTDHYVKDGYEHIVIGDGYVHPAFIEDGEELDEIFIGAFEASGDSSALFSKGGVIPANNIIGASFLAGARARGTKYSLYDMRCVDALWRLMAVEYGCRNSNRILGYGYADFYQAATYQTWSFITQAGTGVNTITCGIVNGASKAVEIRSRFAVGNTICICDTDNNDVIAERVITAVTAENGQPLSITFDGDPIDVTTDMFVGNAPAVCNYCETIGDSYKLNWHTGRANRPPISGAGLVAETMNPCRYRWVENPVGNVWHFLPDVTFVDRQMYVCKSMKDYEMFKNTAPYVPVGPILPKQDSNGNKSDVNSVSQPNYWVTGLLMDIFAKGNNFGKSFDTVHDGTILSTKGYGGYYYLDDDTVCIVNGGGFDHLWRCNMLTNRAWITAEQKWYLYGARLMFKNI